ncbi:MAG: hypothetical protein WAK93_15780 [Solirubrobacteraceae bacterium]
MALFGALALVVIIGGFLAGHSGGGSAPAPYSNFASVGHFQLRYPKAWQLGSIAQPVLGLKFDDPLTLTTNAGTAGLQAGAVRAAGGPTLLPPSVRSGAAGGLPKPQPVLLGNVQAYRYRNVSVHGATPASAVYAVPTSAGVITLACWTPATPPAGFADQCDRIADTLRIVGTTAYPLGPSSAYAKLLSSTFTQLRSSVDAEQAQLKSAKTPTAQAAAATALGHAYGQAASRLAHATVSPRDREAQAAVLAALHTISTGYSNAAAAARSGSHAAYQRAAAQVARGSRALTAATTALGGLGYHVAT